MARVGKLSGVAVLIGREGLSCPRARQVIGKCSTCRRGTADATVKSTKVDTREKHNVDATF